MNNPGIGWIAVMLESLRDCILAALGRTERGKLEEKDTLNNCLCTAAVAVLSDPISSHMMRLLPHRHLSLSYFLAFFWFTRLSMHPSLPVRWFPSLV
jgi:hypothetical protein